MKLLHVALNLGKNVKIGDNIAGFERGLNNCMSYAQGGRGADHRPNFLEDARTIVNNELAVAKQLKARGD